MGHKLNIKQPQLFSEKLQWLKLYDRKEDYTIMVDKYLVKKYVSSIIGPDFIIPTIGVWNNPDEINWDCLPNRFVLKCTHDSGGLVICKDKSKLDIEATKKKLANSLKTNYYIVGREWPYKKVSKRIIAEKYIEPSSNAQDLPDYKWYCFNGEPKYCQVIQNRSQNETIDFFDINWIHQEFIGLNPRAKFAKTPPPCPENLNTHIKIARLLSKDIPFSRIDLYEVNGKTYFGEITLFPASGFGNFKPEQYNKNLGDMIVLP